MLNLFRRKRNRIVLQSVMGFSELHRALDALKEDVYALGEVAGIVACQAVPFLENWVIENWTKGDTPIPIKIQQLYDEAVNDLNRRLHRPH